MAGNRSAIPPGIPQSSALVQFKRIRCEGANNHSPLAQISLAIKPNPALPIMIECPVPSPRQPPFTPVFHRS